MSSLFSLRKPVKEKDTLSLSELKNWKHKQLTAISRLSGRATHSPTLSDLKQVCEQLTVQTLPVFIELLVQSSSALSDLYHEGVLQLIAHLAAVHQERLLPYLLKLLKYTQSMLTRTKLKNAIATTLGTLAREVPLGEPQRWFASFVRSLIDSLVLQQPELQESAAVALERIVRDYYPSVVRDNSARLMERLVEVHSRPHFHAKAELLAIFCAIVDVNGDDAIELMPNILRITLALLSAEQWQTRKAAAEALIEYAEVLGGAITCFQEEIREILTELRYDNAPPARVAIGKALKAFGGTVEDPKLLTRPVSVSSASRRRRRRRPRTAQHTPATVDVNSSLFDEERRKGLVGRALERYYHDNFVKSLRDFADSSSGGEEEAVLTVNRTKRDTATARKANSQQSSYVDERQMKNDSVPTVNIMRREEDTAVKFSEQQASPDALSQREARQFNLAERDDEVFQTSGTQARQLSFLQHDIEDVEDDAQVRNFISDLNAGSRVLQDDSKEDFAERETRSEEERRLRASLFSGRAAASGIDLTKDSDIEAELTALSQSNHASPFLAADRSARSPLFHSDGQKWTPVRQSGDERRIAEELEELQRSQKKIIDVLEAFTKDATDALDVLSTRVERVEEAAQSPVKKSAADQFASPMPVPRARLREDVVRESAVYSAAVSPGVASVANAAAAGATVYTPAAHSRYYSRTPWSTRRAKSFMSMQSPREIGSAVDMNFPLLAHSSVDVVNFFDTHALALSDLDETILVELCYALLDSFVSRELARARIQSLGDLLTYISHRF